METRERKLLDFLNLDLDEETIDQAFEVEGRDIGEKIASYIRETRQNLLETGRGFQTQEDILAVKQIGPERLEIMLAIAESGGLDEVLDEQLVRPITTENPQARLESAEIAVGFAKQASSIVETLQESLRIAESEAFEAKRKALELIEAARIEDVRTAPPFIGRFLSQTSHLEDIYSLDDIKIIGARRINSSEVLLDYITLPETQFFCSGVITSYSGDDVIIRFSRDHISSAGKATHPAHAEIPGSFHAQVKFELREGARLIATGLSSFDSSSFKKDDSSSSGDSSSGSSSSSASSTDSETSSSSSSSSSSKGTSSKEIKVSSESSSSSSGSSSSSSDDSSSSSGDDSSSGDGTSSSGGSSTSTGPGTSPPPTTTASTTCPFYLYIHSSVAEGVGTPGLTAGHAWLTLHDSTGKRIASYGLWPDWHEGISNAGLSNGKGSDVRVNYIGDQRYGAYYYRVCITAAQRKKLATEVAKNIGWEYTNTCAAFASETFFAVTGIDIDADEVLGFETPREVGESIMGANGGTATPSGTTAGAGGGSSSAD